MHQGQLNGQRSPSLLCSPTVSPLLPETCAALTTVQGGAMRLVSLQTCVIYCCTHSCSAWADSCQLLWGTRRCPRDSKLVAKQVSKIRKQRYNDKLVLKVFFVVFLVGGVLGFFLVSSCCVFWNSRHVSSPTISLQLFKKATYCIKDVTLFGALRSTLPT